MAIREVKNLSYSGFKVFESDPEMYYRRYLAINRPPRDPQNHYMAIGSAFDAFVKADLHKRFVDDGDPKFTAEALFETQVEPQNRDRAMVDGLELQRRYIACGGYGDLLEDMKGCINPRFEAELTATLELPRLPGEVRILGKPDVMYIHRLGARVIHDFKCQGFYSKAAPSPSPGYVKILNKGGKGHYQMHRECTLRNHKGFLINGTSPLNRNNVEWATQLSMYAWSLGEDVGSDYILTIDQILSDSQKGTSRVIKHSGICDDKWQNELYDRLHRCWQAATTGHIFLHLPYDESEARCRAIDAELTAAPDATFDSMTEAKPRFR